MRLPGRPLRSHQWNHVRGGRWERGQYKIYVGARDETEPRARAVLLEARAAAPFERAQR